MFFQAGFYYFLNQPSLQCKVRAERKKKKLLVHKTNMPLKPAHEDIDLVKVIGLLPCITEHGRCYVTRLAQCDCMGGL